ncbi:GNAT family N-acetyltransferase [Vannielia litorea]|uniref:Acetyltransferase (GNAT) domain-containing protein n=1 Tax=Vannielia litorea TaxID=1217970 RepID=A0A1N6E4S8_9RHOB|nr:GNAT family N-acetyltransferase [Vannielia litorea]SIN78009.1 Acetyltransferase (GNAT) domain-containing protein [Vannielia litorea]
MSLTVRRLVPAEAGAYRALRLEALRSCPEAFGTSLEEARAVPMLEQANRLQYNTNFGAFVDGALVGILTYVAEEGEKVGHRAWLMGVYVQPAHQGGGAARALLAAALAEAGADGIAQLELHVSEAAPRARAFYLREGFVEVGRSPRALRVDNRYLDELHMLRRLDALEGRAAGG